MDLEFNDGRRRSKIVIALGIVMALLAGGGAYYAVSRAQETAGGAGQRRVPVVVAREVIAARVPITEEMVEIRDTALEDANLAGVSTSVDQVVGRVAAVSILQGQLVTSNMLLTGSGKAFSILQPQETVAPDSEHWRAVSLTIPDDLAIGGLVEPGQTVDIFVTAVVAVPQEVSEDGTFYSDRATKITYQNMLILARQDSYYIVRANLAVAEEIAHLQASGTATFSLALRPDIDQRVADAATLGETTNMIIERYGLPIPVVLDPPAGSRPAATPRPTPTPLPSPSPSASPTDPGAPDASPTPAP